MMKKNVFKVRPKAMNVLLVTFFFIALSNALAFFNVFVMPILAQSILTIFASVYILVDQAFIQSIRKKKTKNLGTADWIVSIIAILGIISAIITLFGVNFSFLEIIQGMVNFLLSISVIIALFKK